MRAEDCIRLIELLGVYESQNTDADAKYPLTASERTEVRTLKADLRDLAVELDSGEEEDGTINPLTAEELEAAARSSVPPDVVAAATQAVLESGRVFVVDEAVPAGSLPPDTLVFRKHELL